MLMRLLDHLGESPATPIPLLREAIGAHLEGTDNGQRCMVANVELLLGLMDGDAEMKAWLVDHSPVLCERLVLRREYDAGCECDSGGCRLLPVLGV